MVHSLLAKAREYIPEDRIAIIEEAYSFAAAAHQGQVRKSGEPFIEHPLNTALFLADLRLDQDTLAAALLHDVVEDCDVASEEIASIFGSEIASLVDGVTKLTKTEIMSQDVISESGLSLINEETAEAATIRKMLMSMAEDVRVVLIKLADRLHNMRTLGALPSDRRQSIAQETLDIYAPLAHRLGIWEIKWQLEDLSFQNINPSAYKDISRRLSAKRKEREEYIENVRDSLQVALEAAGIMAEVTGRPKHIYSIHKKIEKYSKENLGANDIHDLFALRILVDTPQDCYTALGIVHTKWRPLPGQFDDYIANPKDNLYKSLHTAVLCVDAHPVEVQIRTHEMHRVSEYGVAAHWLYKEGTASDLEFEAKMTWLRQIIEWQRDVDGATDYVESFKTDIFQSQVYVYTPKGELKELPAGSTILDFAYRIHTDVGNRSVGGKIGGKLVPLTHKIENGDTVEIVTSNSAGGPSLEWLNPDQGYITTGSARAKVRQWFNRQEHRINVQRGTEIFQKQLRRLTVAVDDQDLAELMEFDSTSAFIAALGDGTITVSQVAHRLSTQNLEIEHEPQSLVLASSPASGVEVLGVGDLPMRIALCCAPILNDPIIGFITRSRGVTVHKKVCSNISADVETEGLIALDWGRSQTLYPIRIMIEAWDRLGLLSDITSLVSEQHVNIENCISEERGEISVVTLTIYINGIDQLNTLFSMLEGVRGVTSVSRASS